ncbi:MAG: preprotein translocase subunit SecE [Planctomycetota bacterium]|nr:preprotein translocase subunit SecE [Planctomycetota bacterium]
MAYKEDQGRLARLVVFWALALLVFYGCYAFYNEVLKAKFDSLRTPLFAGMKKLPILSIELNGAFVIAALLFAALIWLLMRWLQRPKIADLLIETESEMRKVTWPTMSEAVNSSVIVIVCVLFLMVYLAGADWLLGQWATRILTGGRS